MVTQGSFDWTQMCRSILNQRGSSKVPAAMVRMPGRISAVWQRVVPHLPQNAMRSQRPLTSERCSHSTSCPWVISTACSGKLAMTAKALASRRWQ